MSPYFHDPVLSSRGDGCAIWRPVDGVDFICVTREIFNKLLFFDIPDLKRHIMSSRRIQTEVTDVYLQCAILAAADKESRIR